jgi:hypothetical protein
LLVVVVVFEADDAAGRGVDGDLGLGAAVAPEGGVPDGRADVGAVDLGVGEARLGTADR